MPTQVPETGHPNPLDYACSSNSSHVADSALTAANSTPIVATHPNSQPHDPTEPDAHPQRKSRPAPNATNSLLPNAPELLPRSPPLLGSALKRKTGVRHSSRPWLYAQIRSAPSVQDRATGDARGTKVRRVPSNDESQPCHVLAREFQRSHETHAQSCV